MVSVKKIWTVVVVLSLSLLTYADTYYFQGVKEKDANGKEYLIFNDGRADIGFKIDANNKLQLVPIISKTDSIAKQKKINKEVETEKNNATNVQNFVNNLLKLSVTIIGMVGIFLIVFILCILCAIIWVAIGIVTIYKKS